MLLKMSPTAEEEQKLQLYSGELSQLGPAERFLKALVLIPSAYERIDALLFMGSLQEEVSSIKESFATIEASLWPLRIRFNLIPICLFQPFPSCLEQQMNGAF